MPEVTVTYLVHNEIFVVILQSTSDQAKQLASWCLPEDGQALSYAGLTCGQNGNVLLHRSQLNDERTGVYSQLVSADVHNRTIQAITGTIVLLSTLTGERRNFVYERD